MHRPLRILDLLPTQTMEGTVVPYVTESGDFDADVAETAEGAIKPATDISLADGEARAQTVATWVKIARHVLADVPALEQTIRDRLTYKCLRRLETQVLAGDGTGSNLTGILHTIGISEPDAVTGDTPADAVLRGIRTVILSGADPDAIVLHPDDWRDQLLLRAGAADSSWKGPYLSVDGPFATPPAALWGVPVVVTPAITSGQVLVGSFSRGAVLFIREAIHVVLGMESDDLVRNKVTLLGELRAAVAVLQPSAFALCHLS